MCRLRIIAVSLLPILLSILLSGCAASKQLHLSGEIPFLKNVVIGDFEIAVGAEINRNDQTSEKELSIAMTITYLGDEPEVELSYGQFPFYIDLLPRQPEWNIAFIDILQHASLNPGVQFKTSYSIPCEVKLKDGSYTLLVCADFYAKDIQRDKIEHTFLIPVYVE